MDIKYVAKNYKISDKFKDVIEKKLTKLEKYFSRDIDIKVACTEQNDVCKLEITINSAGLFLRSEVSSDNMYNNIDMALPKLERQIRKYRTKLDKQIKMTSQDVVEESEVQRIVRSKQFEVVPMTVDEAMLQIELLGHEFFVFLNVDNNRINVVYKRREGDYGILDPIY